MLKSTVTDFATKQTVPISYFEDDTINVVRQQIAIALNTHPDRLFILVSVKLDHDYYQKDPRRWEALFNRLSYNQQPITDVALQEYVTNYRTPAISMRAAEVDKTDWMEKPEDLEEIHTPTQTFTEYRIFGVEESQSYILPLQFNSVLASRIPAAKFPLPLVSTLISTLYKPSQIEGFLAIPYDSSADSAASVYFPFLRSTTPPRVTDEEVNLLTKNSKLLNDLLNLKVFEPTSVSITRVRFYAKFVTSDFGSAVRTRFEQIFYGLTVSPEVPYIQYFTGRNEVARHKFYVEDPKTKKPYVDMNKWNSWVSRPPQRNIPTLLLFRGDTKDSYDRISVTASDITITLYRNKSNDETVESMKKKVLKWVKTFDAIMTFVDKDDLENDRWDVQDIELYATYSRSLEQIEFLRFNCVSSIFSKTNDEDKFALLRTDRENYGINALQIKIIQLRNEGVIRPSDVAKDLNTTVDEANRLIQQVNDLINEDPTIVDRIFRRYPVIELAGDQLKDTEIKVSSVSEVDRILKYASILRYIVGFPESKSLDAICPKRMETVKVDTGIAPVETVEIDPDVEEQYADLFGYLEADEAEETAPVETEQPKEKKAVTKHKQFSKYGYFKQRLEKFDPDSFTSKQTPSYAKVCEQNYQPIILSQSNLDIWDNTPFDPRTYLEDEKMESTADPDGLVICPEYWCMKDEIPLTEDQLEKEDGEVRCPICGKKLRTSESDDPREYTVIKREEGYTYPGFKKEKFQKTGKNMPCCFKTSQKKKAEKSEDNKYYINREDKVSIKESQLAFLPQQLLDLLQINEKYDILRKLKRISNGMSGFFRVGLGRPSETLPDFLGLKTKVESPRQSVDTVLKCSFFRSFKKLGDSHLESIESSLRKIPPYDKDEYVRTHLAKIISGIDEAFHKKELSMLEELEYSAIFLQCDLFRVFTPANTVGCIFYSPLVRPRSRGIIILQNDRTIDILAHVTRSSRGFQYKSNIFETPFKNETHLIVEKARNQSCVTSVPSYTDALTVIKEVLIQSGKDNFQIVLDPFGRGQALYIPSTMILPFNPVPLQDVSQTKIIGFSEIPIDQLPTHKTVLKYLDIAGKYTEGYKWVEDLGNSSGERVEVLLKSGLRIPVVPESVDAKEPLEIIETTNEIAESKLVFGDESEELIRDYKRLNYMSEIYEFLLFELTHDLKEKFKELRFSLQEAFPNRKKVEPLLQEWFERKVEYAKLDTPIEFLSKVRTPCGQFKSKDSCSGNLCAWNSQTKTCNIEVKPVVRKEQLFHRVLSTLLENSKIRSMILDGRTSPFFSTVLYISLPHELIVTDLDIVNISV
jgi:hypothetical protein